MEGAGQAGALPVSAGWGFLPVSAGWAFFLSLLAVGCGSNPPVQS